MSSNKVTNYFKESYSELKKVVWPSKRETTNYTLLVIAISIGIAAFIGIVDYILTLAFEIII